MKTSIPTAALNLTMAALAVVALGCASATPGRAPEATAEAPAEAAPPARAATVAESAETAAPEAPETAARPREFRVGEREVPLLPEGMTALVVPAIVTEAQPTYAPAPRLPGQEGITAFDVPKPANPNPTGRGRGLPVGPVSTPAPITVGPTVDDPSGGPLGIGIGGGPPAPLAPPFVSTFDSTTFDDNSSLSGSFFIPPDPHAAAGVDHVVNVVNTTIRFHTKAGATTFHAGLASFFAPLAPLTATFDPKVIYDQFEDRFVVVTLEQTDTAFGDPADTSRIFVAVSDDGDPNGAWTLASIPVVIAPPSCGVAAWADYPGFAVDEDAVYITNNLFGFFSFGAPFCGVRLWVIDKGVVGGFYAGGAATTFLSDPYASAGIATTTQPAHVFCTPGGGGTCPSPDGTFLVSYSGLTTGTTDFVQIVRIDTPLSATPTYVQQFLAIGDIEPILAALPSAPQAGSTFPIATNDRRALNAVWRDDDSLWMTATIDPTVASAPADAGEATAHWWQLDTSGADPTYTSLVQQGNISGDSDIAADTFTFFPSIAVNSKNDVAIGFSASAATLFAGSYYTTRVASDPPGFTSPAVPLRPGMDTYERTFDGVGGCSEADSRWGDYSGISVDPTNECFWVYNEHALPRGTPTAGVCGVLPPAGIEDGRWGTAHGEACLCAATKALTTGAWRQVSMPCDPGPADTVAEVFGDDLSGTYDTDWVVYRRDESIPQYVKLATTDSLAVGEGYWIKSNVAAQSVSMGGTINPGADIPLTGVAAAPPAGCAGSAGQCNKVGHPHNFDVCWADVLVDDGGPISLATADPGGSCQTTGVGCIMSRVAHKWTGASYAPFDGTTTGMEGTLVPWDGFFVSANKPGIELRIPAMPGSGPPCGPPAETFGAASPGAPASASGWYIRLIAESDDGMVDRSSVFGQMPGSARGYDSRDLKELDPFGNDYLTLVFPHPEWGVQAGNYASDYRAAGPGLRGESWDFEVRASAPGQNVLLSWEGGAEQFKRSMLVDNTTGKRLRPRPDGSYAFRMRGTSHSFSWQLLGAEQPKPRRSRRGGR